MICLKLCLYNPLTRDGQPIKNWLDKSWKISKYKYLEIQLGHTAPKTLGTELTIFNKTHHPGVYFDLHLLWIYLGINVNDERHWDSKNQRYTEKDLENYN